MKTIFGPLLVCVWALAGNAAPALEPGNVFIVTNKNVPASQEIADHYCKVRGVPRDNIIALDLPAGEDISRADYETRLAAPLRAALFYRRDQAPVLLTIFGVPLRVGPDQPSPEEQKALADIRPQLEKTQADLKKLQDDVAALEKQTKENPKGDNADKLQVRRKERDALQARVRALQAQQRFLSHTESRACVDSELSLLWWGPYELRRFLPNLLNFQVPERLRQDRPPLLLTARLDGPSVELVKRLVDQAVEVEKSGLTGKVYVDARGIRFDPKREDGYGYGGYDESLREMARLLEKDAGLVVTLDDKPALFASQSCPDCSLYCGWYSLANYVDCCQFRPGAVAYHIASSEAVSLRNPKSKYWCKNLLENGACVTIGPVAEPYTIGFPKPAEFFGLLVTGQYPLVECYHRTALLTSWMTVLVGDPLYNPYKQNPKLKPEQVLPSPAGGRFFLRQQ
jgi:uncharacterized protein (TIGR03790 family)